MYTINDTGLNNFLIGKRIRIEREKLGVSQQELCDKIKTFCNSIKAEDRRTLAKWENGEKLPDLNSFHALCWVFNCEMGYLLCQHDCKTMEATDVQVATGLSEEAINVLKKLQTEKNADNEIISFINLIIESIEFRPHMSSLSHSSMEYIKGYIKTKAVIDNPSDIDKMLNSSSTINVDIHSGQEIRVLKPNSSFEDDSDLKYDEYNEKAYHLTKTFERLIMYLSKNAGVFKQLKKIRDENINVIKKRNKKNKRKLDEFCHLQIKPTPEIPIIADGDSQNI